MATTTLRQWLKTEPFTLTMSSGFFSFFAHAGLLSILEEQGLLPNRVSGSSAGALVGSLWASGRPMPDLVQRLFELRKDDFWDPGVGLGLLKGKRFRAILREVAGVANLDDCPVPCCVSAYDAFARDTRVFMDGQLDKAVYAACAVPLLFRPIWIDGRPYWDGGIKDRPGLAGIEHGARVLYHHIKSRSAWRKKNSSALTIPHRANMAYIVIDNLPRVGPNQLSQGQKAYYAARTAVSEALDQPIGVDSIVRV